MLRDADHVPFRDDIISRLGLSTINIQTKFDVSNYTLYEDMKSGAKVKKNLGSFGQSEVTQGHQQCGHSIECIQLPIRL